MREFATVRFAGSSVALALIGTVVLLVNPVEPGHAARLAPGPSANSNTSPSPSPTAKPSGVAGASVSGTAHVLDGDTIDLGGVRIRLEGIDAPETGQTCGRKWVGTWSCGAAATNVLEKLTLGQDVTCNSTGTDKYGRMLGICRAGAIELNAEMVRQGYAWAFVKYSARYLDVEAEARASRAGVWQGDADPPWVFRERRWVSAEQTAPEGCAIKGNISNKGQIYHMPWSPWYGRVKVDESRGERWFCTEAEAVTAGWRPANGK